MNEERILGIRRFKPVRIRMNETKVFRIEFVDDFDSFAMFVKEFPFARQSPIMDLERPVDSYGMEQYKKHVTNVSYAIISPNILVIHIETDPSLDERLALENAQEAEALGDA